MDTTDHQRVADPVNLEAAAPGLTVDIVSAYVRNNAVPASELPKLIQAVHAAIVGLAGDGGTVLEAVPFEKPSAAEIKRSITPDALISFLDGKPYKTIRRHLTTHGFSPEAYRRQFGLPDDYPLVAASYSAQRSALAKSIGLGVPGGQTARGEAANALAA